MTICKRGHAVVGKCIECRREKNREYMRRIRAAHPERERERNIRWETEHRERRRELNRKSQLKHREKVLERKRIYGRAWRKANRARLSLESRKRLALLDDGQRCQRRAKNQAFMKKWREANPEAARAARRAWGKKNPLREREHDHRYRARKKAALVAPVTVAFLRGLLDSQDGRCHYCRALLDARKHVDHKQPLSRGGSHEPSNVCWTCPRCNISKKNKTEQEFFAYREACA